GMSWKLAGTIGSPGCRVSGKIKLKFGKLYCPSTSPLAQSASPLGHRGGTPGRSEEHTSELQSLTNLVCRLLLEKKKHKAHTSTYITTVEQKEHFVEPRRTSG